MIKCPTCGTSNLESSQYCDECGAAIIDSNPANILESPQFQSASVTSVGVPLIMEESKINNNLTEGKSLNGIEKSPNAKLIIERGNAVGTEFFLKNNECYIGRWDADNGIFPDIDLDVHDPEAKVSRRHARIVYENTVFHIEDLGSTNGTFVNRGRRLIPGSPQLLSDGDEIIVGKTFLRFQVI